MPRLSPNFLPVRSSGCAPRAHAVRHFVSGLGLALVVSGCGSGPTQPASVPQPIPPPPNSAPVIQAVTLSAAGRAEVDSDVVAEAVVVDAESPADSLSYTWTASAGVFAGAGRRVTWRLPKNATATPVIVTIRVAVTESYPALENGTIVTRQHRVEAAAAPLRAHDSDAEVRQLVLTFLGRFTDNNVPAAQVVSDFSNQCPGKQAELEDVEFVRATRTVVSATYNVQSVTFNAARTTADVVAPCRFQSVIIATGAPEDAPGTCLLTGVYESGLWKLCTSNFAPSAYSPLGARLSQRVR